MYSWVDLKTLTGAVEEAIQAVTTTLHASSWGNSGGALRSLSELNIAGATDLAKGHDDEHLSSRQ